MSKNSICWRGRDRLAANVYMPPMKDIDDHKSLDAAGYPVAGPVDHFTLYFNARYPGMDMPHYHVVLWHVTQGAGSAGRENEVRLSNNFNEVVCPSFTPSPAMR
jgi:hypothetical protein